MSYTVWSLAVLCCGSKLVCPGWGAGYTWLPPLADLCVLWQQGLPPAQTLSLTAAHCANKTCSSSLDTAFAWPAKPHTNHTPTHGSLTLKTAGFLICMHPLVKAVQQRVNPPTLRSECKCPKSPSQQQLCSLAEGECQDVAVCGCIHSLRALSWAVKVILYQVVRTGTAWLQRKCGDPGFHVLSMLAWVSSGFPLNQNIHN